MKKVYKENQKELDEICVRVQAMGNQYHSKLAELSRSMDMVTNEYLKKIKEVQDMCPHDWEFYADVYDSHYFCKSCGKEKKNEL